RGRLSPSARPRGHLHQGVHRHRARAARPHRRCEEDSMSAEADTVSAAAEAEARAVRDAAERARASQARRLMLAPWLCTIGFFLLWEVFCRVFRVSSYVLPAPSDILDATIAYWWPLLFHSFHTLWMTTAGFILAIV